MDELKILIENAEIKQQELDFQIDSLVPMLTKLKSININKNDIGNILRNNSNEILAQIISKNLDALFENSVPREVSNLVKNEVITTFNDQYKNHTKGGLGDRILNIGINAAGKAIVQMITGIIIETVSKKIAQKTGTKILKSGATKAAAGAGISFIPIIGQVAGAINLISTAYDIYDIISSLNSWSNALSVKPLVEGVMNDSMGEAVKQIGRDVENSINTITKPFKEAYGSFKKTEKSFELKRKSIKGGIRDLQSITLRIFVHILTKKTDTIDNQQAQFINVKLSTIPVLIDRYSIRDIQEYINQIKACEFPLEEAFASLKKNTRRLKKIYKKFHQYEEQFCYTGVNLLEEFDIEWHSVFLKIISQVENIFSIFTISEPQRSIKKTLSGIFHTQYHVKWLLSCINRSPWEIEINKASTVDIENAVRFQELCYYKIYLNFRGKIKSLLIETIQKRKDPRFLEVSGIIMDGLYTANFQYLFYILFLLEKYQEGEKFPNQPSKFFFEQHRKAKAPNNRQKSKNKGPENTDKKSTKIDSSASKENQNQQSRTSKPGDDQPPWKNYFKMKEEPEYILNIIKALLQYLKDIISGSNYMDPIKWKRIKDMLRATLTRLYSVYGDRETVENIIEITASLIQHQNNQEEDFRTDIYYHLEFVSRYIDAYNQCSNNDDQLITRRQTIRDMYENRGGTYGGLNAYTEMLRDFNNSLRTFQNSRTANVLLFHFRSLSSAIYHFMKHRRILFGAVLDPDSYVTLANHLYLLYLQHNRTTYQIPNFSEALERSRGDFNRYDFRLSEQQETRGGTALIFSYYDNNGNEYSIKLVFKRNEEGKIIFITLHSKDKNYKKN